MVWNTNKRYVMSGKVLLDTNAIIYALNGKVVLPYAQYLASIIAEIELFLIVN